MRVGHRADALRHPALEPARGEPIESAALNDRARLAVVLQAAGLLSLLEVAGWTLADEWRGARVDRQGRLSGLAAVPGRRTSEPAPVLLALLRSLFGGGEIAGRGEARRAARAVVARWSSVLDRVSADRAVSDLLEAAPFLSAGDVAGAALAGTLVRGGREVPWRAGRAARAVPAVHPVPPTALVAAGRWRAAVAAFEREPPADDAERLDYARALFGAGRAQAALALLAGRTECAAQILRAECQHALGELGAARETVRRLESRKLTLAERLAAGDVALRVLASSGEPERARDWAASALAGSRGRDRLAARLLVALAAADRGDREALERALEQAAPAAEDACLEPRWHEAAAARALARSDGEALVHHVVRRFGCERRRLRRYAAGRLWNDLGIGRLLRRQFVSAERAFGHSARLLRGCDGPLGLTLAATNLADVRLRLGRLAGVEPILEASHAWNRRSGNLRGRLEDELLLVRFELVRGRFEAALARCGEMARLRAEAGNDWSLERAVLFEARALGWLGRPAEARAALAACARPDFEELEPEELPFLFALAGETDRALDAAAASGFGSLVGHLVRGETPPAGLWRTLAALEPYRRARFVFDAEAVAPGNAPEGLREEAAALLRALGAQRMADRLERPQAVAWRALSAFFARPADDRGALEELLSAVGHPEAELVLRQTGGERRLAGVGGRALPAERSAVFGAGELVLRAERIDEPLRALFALFLRELPPPVAPSSVADAGLVGESPALRAALDRLRRFAATGLPVLLLGENGTGKELAAREVHRASARASGPWLTVNCAGLAETLLLAELFGHARGAFTGADRERAGLFESARGGSLFLDEIGDFPGPAQGSLLRVLQEGEIRRLGEALPRRVDVRVVAATNRDLETMVEQGAFRQDLWFRLKAATVLLPPLRERGGDVLLLAAHFLGRLRRRRPELRLTPEARRALAAHSWPGNVRELAHALEAAAALTADGRIAPEHLDLGGEPVPAAGRAGEYHVAIEVCRRRLIEEALAGAEGSLAAAARRLGVSRQFLSQYVRKFGLAGR